MKIIRKILKIFFSVILFFLIVFSLLIFTFLKWPEVIINSKNLDKYAYLTRYFGWSFYWDSSDIKIVSSSLLHKEFDFSWKNICFESKNEYQGCFQQLGLKGELKWEKGFKIVQLGSLNFLGGKINLKIEEKKQKNKNKEISFDPPTLILPKFLQSTAFEKSQIEIKELSLDYGDNSYQGNLNLILNSNSQKRIQEILLQAKIESNSISLKKADLKLISESNFMKEDWQLLGEANIEKSAIQIISSKFQISKINLNSYQYQLDLNLIKNKLISYSQLKGKISSSEVEGSISSELKGIRKEIKKIYAQNCNFDLKRLELNKHRGRFSFDCPVRVDLTPVKLPSATYTKYITIPDQLDFLIKTDFETSFYPDFDQEIAGNLWIDLKPISQKLAKFQGNLNTTFSGVPSQYPKKWKIDSDLKSSLLISQSEKIVQILHPTAWAIPAPLNVLKGAIEIGVSGKIDLTNETGKFPIYFKSGLSSSEQNFNLDGNGELSYQYIQHHPISDLFFDLKLSALKIVLPRFDFNSAVPQFFPDSRIDSDLKNHSKKTNVFPIRYHAKIYTLPEKPVLFISNLAKTPIPIDLNLTLENEKLEGLVQIGQTDLNFFKRDAKIQRLKINLENPRSESELNGVVEVALTDYLIRILILGTVDKPQVIFRSEPPLPEEQLMSTLIFGRSFDELDTNNASSVGSFSAALADRAISLASLYLLASTPIESIGYNPQTRAFLAKIRLAKGTSLNLGTEWGKSEQVGVNKKIGKKWFLKTYFENDQETNKQSGGASLNWSKRY